jgi:hypothetical protein
VSNGTDWSNGIARFPSLYSVAIRAGLFHLTKSNPISAHLLCPQVRQFVECWRKETTGASLFDTLDLGFFPPISATSMTLEVHWCSRTSRPTPRVELS